MHYSQSSGFSEYSECASGDVGEVGGDSVMAFVSAVLL